MLVSRRILLLSLVSRESVRVRERNDQNVLNSTRVIHIRLFWYAIELVFREDFGAVLMFRIVSYTSFGTISNTSYDTGMLTKHTNPSKKCPNHHVYIYCNVTVHYVLSS